jgi:hypothetical protein
VNIERRGRKASSVPKQKKDSGKLIGWQQIATFLGQPLPVAQRWAKSGMPVIRERRKIYASPEARNRWLGCEAAGEPVQIATEDTDPDFRTEARAFLCSEALASWPAGRSERRRSRRDLRTTTLHCLVRSVGAE